ncbi:MAG TPA: ComEC/Rec2 family competence protein [Cyclobacteriaceae bacterium]|jgi:competence protein ComEC|nr:ComEC/Rec2 family competence protein [Cyclobacteriaceae bacterium]
MKWLPYPMIRIALFFMGGASLGIYFSNLVSFQVATGLLIFCLAGFFTFKLSFAQNRFPVLLGFLGLSSVFLFGLIRVFLFIDSNDKNHLSRIKSDITAYEAIVRGVPEKKAKSWRIEIEVTAIKTDDEAGAWQPATGKLLLYISAKDFTPPNFHYDDKILVRGNLQELRPPSNPGEFDFKRFLSFKNISHQQFVQPEDVKFVSATSWRGFIYYSHQARAWSMKKINEYVHGDDERAIAIALVLGVTDGIDNDLQNAYAASGAMHVLAVSGMHVGIIYAIILFLFRPLNKYKWCKWVVALTSLILLWAFAFVTGLSPSVLRAVTMFSFIALALPFGKQTNIYNSLGASAFVLLVYNPFLITSVGFQLSYLAVLGIVYLQRPIYNLWDINNPIGDWVWKITCVSIAAQFATFALSLLYFHQFPTYFLISNLFVIPLSTAVLVSGILLLTVSFIPPLASFTAIILEGLIKALNWIVFSTEALPFSLINNIYVSAFQCWVLAAMLVALILVFEFKSMRWLYTSLVLVVVFAFLQWNHFFESVDQRQMIVYSINNHQAIEFIDRGQSYFVCDSSLQIDPERIRYHIQPNRLIHGVSTTEFKIPFGKRINGVNYYRWNNKTIAWISEKDFKLPTNAFFDYLIVSKNSLRKEALDNINANCVILDGSNSKRFVTYIGEHMKNRKIQTHSVALDGAYIFND